MAGGLMSYGINLAQTFRLAGLQVVRIIKGEKDRQGTRPDYSSIAARPRRRGDRIGSPRTLLHLLTSAAVKVFGRLHDDPIRARRRQAYEKHQGTKSQEVERLQCSGLHEGLIETRTLMRPDRASSDQVDGAFKRVMPLPF